MGEVWFARQLEPVRREVATVHLARIRGKRRVSEWNEVRDR